MGHVRTGIVCALIGVFATAATVAVAGTGIGDVFNLGQTNPVNGASILKGSTAGPQLQVNNSSAASGAYALAANGASGSAPVISGANSGAGPGFRGQSATGVGVVGQTGGASSAAGKFTNTGGGPAGSFNVNSGVAPFSVNSSTEVSGLNSSLLGGYAVTEVSRAGLAGSQTFGPSPTWSEETSVTLTAPKQGFVLVEGTVVADDYNTAPRCSVCFVAMLLRDGSGVNADSPEAEGSYGNGTNNTGTTLARSWVFPVSSGSHTFSMQVANAGAAGDLPDFDNPTLTALFVPAGSNGSPSILNQSGAPTTHRVQP